MATPTDSGKRPRGRPKVHASNAERARAWRERQKQLLEEATTPTPPVIIEKVVERIPSAKGSHDHENSADARKLVPGLADYSQDSLKSLMTNLSRTRSTLQDMYRAAERARATTELDFLQRQLDFVDEMRRQAEILHRSKAANAKQRADDYERSLERTSEELFGKTPDRAHILTMALHLVRFGKKEGTDFLCRKYGNVKSDIDIQFVSEKELERWNDARLMRFVASTKKAMPERPWSASLDGIRYYSPGWDDFKAFVASLPAGTNNPSEK